ncbi:lysozyme inhibitor LprI family protein [Gracilibacillus sp. HCP3S3_G5_1]|uniref:lysozyme inhibitor LprI family protein n=1 Tax=unclassified Gracilibacillus TaxID=2625209 RepID=UPI003F8AF875
MDKKKSISIFIFLVIIMLAACEGSSAQSESAVNNHSLHNHADEANNDSIKKDLPETIPDEENEHNELENGKTSNQSKEEQNSSVTNSTTNLKETYLNKLHNTNERTEKMEAVDSSTYALKDVAHNQYKEWDDLLNEIYGVLEDQLSAEEMSKLREEQRDWIAHRDETAKEASLQYEGGTMEQLEYVTVLANVTKDRCYEFVEAYMK